jgi:amino acid permease
MGSGNNLIITAPPAIYVVTTGNTTVGALQEAPFSHDLRIVAAIVFPIGAIPLVLLLRRRRALKATGWLAVLLFASIVGLSIGCGSSGFEKQQGTTSTGTPAATYQFVVTATGTASDGSQINIKSYPFAVTVSAVH